MAPPPPPPTATAAAAAAAARTRGRFKIIWLLFWGARRRISRRLGVCSAANPTVSVPALRRQTLEKDACPWLLAG